MFFVKPMTLLAALGIGVTLFFGGGVAAEPSSIQALTSALQGEDLVEIGERIDAQRDLLLRSGSLDFEELGELLISRAEALRAEGRRDHAAFFIRRALDIGSNSPRTLMAALPLAKALGVAAPSELLWRAVQQLPERPDLIILGLLAMSYPALWSVTGALLLTLLVLMLVRLPLVLRALARFVPTQVAGLMVPIALLVLVLAPTYGGPLWTLVAWAVLVGVTLPRERWVVFVSGVVVALWGISVPFIENTNLWQTDRGVQSMLRVLSGRVLPDLEPLQHFAKTRPDDAVAQYALGIAYRRLSRLEEAEGALARAVTLAEDTPWITAERGLVAFLRGDLQQSDTLMEQASAIGGARYLFNRSKVKFALLMPSASEELLRRALDENPVLVRNLQSVEERLGVAHAASFAEMTLPAWRVLRSARYPAPGAENAVNQRMASIFPGVGPRGTVGIGILVVLLTLCLGGGRREPRFHQFYSAYRPHRGLQALVSVLPGGAFALQGRCFIACTFLSLSLFMVSPILRWPHTSTILFDQIPGLIGLYAACVAGFLVTGVVIGLMVRER